MFHCTRQAKISRHSRTLPPNRQADARPHSQVAVNVPALTAAISLHTHNHTTKTLAENPTKAQIWQTFTTQTKPQYVYY